MALSPQGAVGVRLAACLCAAAWINLRADGAAAGGVAANPLGKLFPASPQAQAFFGQSVAVSGEALAVGAFLESGPAGAGQGAAYVFERVGDAWVERVRLTAGDPAPQQHFGFSVALHGDTLIVGAPRDASLRGAAYVFVRSGTSWVQQAKLLAPDGEPGDFFGIAVALDGDTAAVGAWHDTEAGIVEQGSVYVFTRSGTAWSQQAKLVAADADFVDNLGVGLALDGDTLIAGARGFDVGRGAAYVFVRSGTAWSQQAKLVAAQGAQGDSFGFSVALEGDTAVITAYGDDHVPNNSGAAYVFTRSGTTWFELDKLVAADAADEDQFGRSVALRDGVLVVGAPFDNGPAGVDQGALYAFAHDGEGWKRAWRLYAPQSGAGDLFGFSLGFADGVLVVGANGDDDEAGANQGSAYVFAVQPTCPGDLTGDLKVDQSDLGILLASYGCDAGPFECPGDVDADGAVGQSDLGLLLADYGKPCP